MDLHMPVMDGYTAASLIRKFNTDVPIVAMTADAISGVEEQCRAHGIYSYVSKPFEPEQLIETLVALLGGKEPKQRFAPAKTAPAQTAEEHADVVDFADGRKRIGGDDTIYRLVLKSFLEETASVEADLKCGGAGKRITFRASRSSINSRAARAASAREHCTTRRWSFSRRSKAAASPQLRGCCNRS